jgi:uncharacterized protein YbbC (DUF1343 family)
MRKLLIAVLLLLCVGGATARPLLGNENIGRLLQLIAGRRVALVVNQTSIIGGTTTHLVDTLLSLHVHITKIFSPEHGFRGLANAGAAVNSGRDTKTHLPVVSLFGKQVKPTRRQLRDVDVVIYDIQDVGLRFYTYISTLHYVMEACADYGKEVIVLDRPNPNDFVDGPMMDDKNRSFIGVDPLPMLYGMTCGELARCINGEHWLKTKADSCRLQVVPVQQWRHGESYSLPVKASPNLPNDQSIRLYASICIMGPTGCSVGRGTDFPFQVVGFPDKRYGTFCFTPHAMEGFDTHPIHEGEPCYGLDLRHCQYEGGFTLRFLLHFYELSGRDPHFIKDPVWFARLAGSDTLRQQILSGMNEDTIRATWQDGLKKFLKIRAKYLRY